MKVAIIIPTINEEATIGRLIKSLNEDPFPKKEIIVIDGGSSDNTVRIAKENGAIVLKEKGEHRCPANARNQGVEKSTAEVICFLDGDTDHANSTFITSAAKHFKNPAVIGVWSKGETIDDTLLEKVLESIGNSFLVRTIEQKLSRKFKSFTFLRRAIFEELGGFPLLGFGEDKILWQNVGEFLRNNPEKKIVFESNSKLFTHNYHSLSELFRGAVWHGRTLLPFFERAELKKQMKLFQLLVPPVTVLSIVSIPLTIISPWFFIVAFPYLVKLFFIILESIKNKNKYHLLTPIIDLVHGVGFTGGLFQYLIKIRSLSREL